MNTHYPRRPPARERGAVLIVGLVMLLVLVILGLTSSQNTTLEERMSGNYRDRTLALQAAEAALREGEADLANPAEFAAMQFNGSDGTREGVPNNDPMAPSSWLNHRTLTDLRAEVPDLLVADPAYYIERLREFDAPQSSLVVGTGGPPPPQMRFYRITGRGQGQTPSAEVILQSSYFTL